MTQTTTTAPAKIEAKAYRLTGITRTSGQCDACSRELTQRVFSVAHKVTGETLDLTALLTVPEAPKGKGKE